MLSLSSQSRIFIHALPTDMRKSFDGLCGIVKGDFQKDILEGDYFVFFNRVLDRCKILLWDRDGLSCSINVWSADAFNDCPPMAKVWQSK